MEFSSKIENAKYLLSVISVFTEYGWVKKVKQFLMLLSR